MVSSVWTYLPSNESYFSTWRATNRIGFKGRIWIWIQIVLCVKLKYLQTSLLAHRAIQSDNQSDALYILSKYCCSDCKQIFLCCRFPLFLLIKIIFIKNSWWFNILKLSEMQLSSIHVRWMIYRISTFFVSISPYMIGYSSI